ncbi:MAG: metallophosphatase domain-containing protein [Candidatus Symbiothrix sp.]|jgi:Icc-related predicted phosphoesterase|nr:metallophosphatase domain-containing protein [Candidatus Symbiothrix sp.]
MTKLLFLSDTHTQHRQLQNLPEADIVVFGGDIEGRNFRRSNEEAEHNVLDFVDWFCGLNYRHKIFIAGNHDLYFADKTVGEVVQLLPENVHYLCDSGVEICGIKFWGSPVSPVFHNYWAFTETRGKEIARHWALIPKDTDVLITHCPPFGILDLTENGEHIGCVDLLKTVQEIKSRYHLFGHVHESYGIEQQGETTFINGSVLNKKYQLANRSVMIEIGKI